MAEAAPRAVFAPGLFEGRVAFVTGGGTGIGFACARTMLELGARVAICGRRQEVIGAAAEKLDKTGKRVCAVPCDIRKPEEVEAAVARIVQALGPIDVLVNNAGGQFPAPAEALSLKGLEAVVRNNLFGTWNVTREVAKACMIPKAGGSIVNIIANVVRGFPGMLHTGAARAGVENMTRTLAIEWVHHKIRVNAVAPGTILTEGLGQYSEPGIEYMRKGTPMKRLGTAQEVANVAVFLCSAAASYVTGSTYFVDGAQSLWGETWPIPEPE